MEKEENSKDKADKPVIVRNIIDLQRLKLEKLMKNPEKPIIIPERPKEKGVPSVPEFVRNVMGSSAGAGSGEFHVYRHLRRKEYARQKYMKEKGERERLDEEYKRKLEENRLKAEERTAKKRAKRLKKKAKMKNKSKKPKLEKKSESEESNESQGNETDDESLLFSNSKCSSENVIAKRDLQSQVIPSIDSKMDAGINEHNEHPKLEAEIEKHSNKEVTYSS